MIKNQNHQCRLRIILKRFIAFVIAVCIVLGDPSIGSMISYATETVGTPEIKISFSRISGGEPTGTTNTTLLANGEEMFVYLQMDPGFQKGYAEDLVLNLQLPYFYYEDSHLLPTTDINLVPPEQQGENLMGVRARIVNYGNFEYNNQAEDTVSFLDGPITLEADGARLEAGKPQSVQLALSFYGNVPENASAVVRAGGSYGSYTLDGVTSDGGYHVQPGVSNGSSYTVVNSNLKWEMEVRQVCEQVLWDKYNYMTYEVTMKNISESEKSYFDSFAINFQVPSNAQSAYGEGLLDKDAMAWIYDQDTGDPIANTNPDITSNSYYVGVPSQGGILVYDVTGKTSTELDGWNLETYLNVNETSLPYSYTNNRLINIYIDEPVRYAESKTFYIAVPFTNNFPESTGYKVPTDLYPTVYLGTDIKWSKTYNFTGQFAFPDPGFAHEKYVLDDTGAKKESKEIAIAGTGQYYISGLKNTGNLPAFNAVVTDTLPDKFDLKKVKIQMDNNPYDPTYVPELKEWFKTDNILEFGFEDGDGTIHWVSLGNFDSGTATTGGMEWSIDLDGAVKDYLLSTTGLTFTKQIRFNLAERIDKNMEFNGRIIVEGVAEELATYKNKIVTNFDEKLYAPSTTSSGEQYYTIPQSVGEDNAIITTAPAVTQIETVAFKTLPDKTIVYATPAAGRDSMKVPLRYSGVGFRYNLGNSSISPAIPAVFKSGNLLSGSGGGLAAEKIILSKELLAHSEIDYIMITDRTGNDKAKITSWSNLDANGNAVISSSAWIGNVRYPAYVQVVFKNFDEKVALTDEAYIMIEGQAGVIGEIPVEGSFETKYSDNAFNTIAKDESVLNASTIYPNLEAYSYNTNTGQVSGTNTNSTKSEDISGLSVPKSKDNTGYVFRIFNKSESGAGETHVTINFPDTGVKSDTSTSAPAIVDGFLLQDMYFSANLNQVGIIDKILFYDYDQNPADASVVPALTINWATDMTPLSDGSYHITETMLSAAGADRFKTIKIIFSDILGQADENNPEKLELKLDGMSDQWGTMNAVMKFEPLDATMANKIMSVTARLSSITPELSLTAQTYNANVTPTSYSGVNTHTTASNKISSLEVANKADNVGYIFKITNSSVSATGETEVLVNFPNTGTKNDVSTGATPVVKGFRVQDMYFSANANTVGKIEKIEFYDYNKTSPSVTLDWATDVTTLSDGRFYISESQFAGMTHMKSFKIIFSDIYGQANMSAQQTLQIQMDGIADWFDNLDAVLRAEMLDPTMYQWSQSTRIRSVTGRLYVARPELMIHTNIYYYPNVTETSHTSTSSSDGNVTRLGIPYDRDFKYRVSIENETISVLDDVDVMITLPITAADESAEANTGFHTTNIVLSKEFIEQFEEFESITFYDRNDVNGITYTYNAATQTLSTFDTRAKELILPKNDDGDWVFEPADVGVSTFYKMAFTGDKVKLQDASTAEAWVDFYGYSDSYFGTNNTIKAEADNYLDGIRESHYQLHTEDTSISTVSKMYFDTVVAAGFKDVETGTMTGNRFDQISSAVEHVRQYWNRCYYRDYRIFLDDSELDVGYKAIGSFMLDFRQYLNTGYNYPVDYPRTVMNSYHWQEHQGMSWIKTQSFNTAANVSMKMSLPSDYFDAYYVKVHPDAINYLNSITVYRADNTSVTYGPSDWASRISVEKFGGKDYYVIPLILLEDGTSDKYVSPINYGIPANPVTDVTFEIDINESVADVNGNAVNPDFGTGYNAQDESTKYMFEVTGRFYKYNTAGTKAEAKVSTTMTVGGGRSKLRVDSGDVREKTDWSYKNQYKAERSYTYYSTDWAYIDYDAAHLVSRTRVHVQNDNNLVLKGVHSDTSKEYDDGVEFASKQYYSVAFYRNTAAYDHDYETGQGTNWKSQDADDWSGKVSFVDEVYLEDTLPYIANDPDSLYIGFRTEDVQFSEALYKYLDKVEFTLSDGSVVTKQKADITASSSAGYYEVVLKYDELGETLTTGKTNEILLSPKTFLSSYKVTLLDIPGSCDYARELFGRTGLLTADKHGGSGNIDVRVGGYVHLVKNLHADAWGTNNILSSYKNDDMTSVDATYRTSSGSRASTLNSARLMGYQIPFSAGWKIERTTTGTEYDYLTDNETPDVTSFGVKLWNRPDGTTGPDQSSRLDYAKATNTLPTAYNLKRINIPAEFVTGDWFRVKSITLNYDNSKSASFDLTSTYVKQDSATGDYYFDVNHFIRDNLTEFKLVGSYGCSNTTATYIKEHINSFVIEFEAYDVDINDDSTLLDGGQYISKDTKEGYAFTYDGVWVNRTETDIQLNLDTAYSRPTFGIDANLYDGINPTNSVSASFRAADLNAKNKFEQASGTSGSVSYWVKNLVGQMVVRLDRGTTWTSTGTDGTTVTTSDFAYDRNAVTDGAGTTSMVEHGVDRNHLIPYDYIDYTLTVGASDNSPIPLQHTDLRFVAPTGQRIVGWAIASNGATDIADDKITAAVKDASGADVALKEGVYYVGDSRGAATNYKEINISLGDEGNVMDGDLIKKGEKVQIVVYTQLTDEIASFENAAITSTYTAVSRPKHTYSQYSIFGLNASGAIQGNTDTIGSNHVYYTDDVTNSVVHYYRYYTDFYRINGTPYTGNDYTSVINNKLTFRKMDDNLALTYTYTDVTSQYDRQGMMIKLYNSGQADITNDTQHTLKEITFEVSFMSKHNASTGEERYFKSFELTKKPVFVYPTNMDNAGTPVDMWYLVEVDGKDTWIEAAKIKEGEVTEEEKKDGFHSVTEVKKVKWTYYNVPEMGNDGNEVLFAAASAPFTFEGLGLYNDIRENTSTKIADRYNMILDAKMNAVHEHREERIDEDGKVIPVVDTVEFSGTGAVTTVIARERPVLTYQTQIFSTLDQASADYAYNASQKNGYRPGDTMWYKVTVVNNKLTTEAAAKTGLQGVLLDPVFYDKIPEYVTANMSQIQVRWKNADGSVKTDAPALQVSDPVSMNAADYGGDMVNTKNTLSEGARGNGTGNYFSDIIPSDSNSTQITYDVYQFSFAEGTRLEVGESIEIWYPVTVRLTELPMSYVRDASGNVYPEYYPKIGEYYQWAFYESGSVWNGVSWPLGNSGRSGALGDGHTRTITNSNIMMDMSYLIHDVGISGTINENVDRWEYLMDSITYIPGSASNNPTGTFSAQIYGNNSRLLDMDSASASVWQQVKYAPNISGSDLDILPTSIEYRGAGNANRDVYKYVVQPRTDVSKTAWDSVSGDEKHVPILWSEARTHLQTAWLATSSEIIPDCDTGETRSSIAYANHAKQYLKNAYTVRTGYGVTNPYYDIYIYDDSGQEARHNLLPDDHISTVEYDETYTARLSAYNYGDWTLDGVEFIYVLPRGVSPQKDASGNYIVNGCTITGGNSYSPSYSDIDASNIQVEVLQDPTDSKTDYYLSPKSIQDPALVQSKWNTTADVYDQAYYSAADSESWVLKITVRQPLKKWFNRGSDMGYILHVDVRCHVDSTNESEYWYDKVFTRPIEIAGVNNSNDSAYYQIYDITTWQGDTKDKATQTSGSLSTQYGGMDILWDGYDNYYGVDGATAYNSGSPNMPYINGFNIQNNEVHTDADVNGIKVSGDQKSYYASGTTQTWATTGTRAQMRKPLIRTWTTMGDDLDGSTLGQYYLNTEAEQSKINIHVENKYYWNEQTTENYSPLTSGYKDGNASIRHLHNYSTDGGNEGTFFFPVVTNILPAGTVPMYKETADDGSVVYKTFTTDNAVNATKTLDWTLYNRGGAAIPSEQALYTAKVEYIEITNAAGEAEGRYKVVFYQNQEEPGNAADAKIISGDKRIFSFRMVTVDDPDMLLADGTKEKDLLKQYQTDRLYVTSQLDGFKFKIDREISGNPYYVGAYWTPYYASKYHVGDSRLDAIYHTPDKPGTSNDVPGGNLPNSRVNILKKWLNGGSGVTYSIIDATDTGGVIRYNENGTFQMEDYSTIRDGLLLSGLQQDFDMSGAFTHVDAVEDGEFVDSGVFTSMRIRTKSPRMGVLAYVSQSIDSIGERDTASGDAVTHYPTTEFDTVGYKKSDKDHKQYGDNLYYTARISNKPSSSTAYSEKGDVKHAKIVLSVVLPSNVTYEDEYYIEKTVGSTVQRMTATDLANAGWQISIRDSEIDPVTNEETIVFEIITPGETTSYEEYLQGKHVAGFFASGDEFDFRIKTVIDSLEEPSTVRTGADYWDEEYYADMYVTLDDTDGSFTGIEGLKKQDLDQTVFQREVKDQAATDTSAAVDHDMDGDYDERFTSDRSARVTVLKPSAEVRLDTSIQRVQLNNPDAGIIIAEDASIKGATVSNVYLDQAVNTGGAVGEFIVDYRVPHRGTTSGTIYEAEAPSPALTTSIYEIRTGIWEVPQMDDPAYYAALCDKLKVNVYVRVTADPENVAYDSPGALDEYATEAGWHSLGSYGLTDNKVIAVPKEWQDEIRQIRFVIKAGESGDSDESRNYPVPQGFRLDIDADLTTTPLEEEMDTVDPDRYNVKVLPGNVTDNAAYIQMTMKHKGTTSAKLHANNFATVWGRYDDVQYSALSDPARAGYFINVELPVIQKDLVPYYFHRYKNEAGENAYEWSSTDLLIKQTYSTMLKYVSVLKNLDDEEIEAVNIKEKQDNATNPIISVVLPYIQDIDDNNFQYVDAYSSDFDSSYVNSDYKSDSRLEQSNAQWTYYIVDKEGNRISNSEIKDYQFKTYDKQINLSGDTRKILTWEFEGYLEPGQSIVVEYMVPINTKDYGIVSSELMTCSSHGYLNGSFKQYIPESTNTNETYSVEVDVRDINDNGQTNSETALIKRVGGIAFDTERVINRLKYSYSEYDKAGLQISRPALVPEGTDYSFKSAALNPDAAGELGFAKTIIYDVLPYIGDITIVNEHGSIPDTPGDRGSKWSGWVLPDTIELNLVTTASSMTTTKTLVDGTDCEIWIGPFTQDASGKITAKSISDLPVYAQTSDTDFYLDAYKTESIRQQYFVKLSELMKLKDTNPSEYMALSKNIMAIWVQVANEKELFMNGGTKFELNYSLHAPLNLPQYQGVITSDMEDDIVRQSVVEYTGWNTFAVQTNVATEADTKMEVTESPQAGVYLNAPVEKGYIGSYVWYDFDYDTVIDEGEYTRRSDGRLIFQNATQDLDFDGVLDDPGINGVLVELLSESGYPVNKLGEPVVEVEESGVTKYVLIDETTGLKAKDANGTYLYTTEGPASFTTEADAYGNNGYFIISNIKPGNYKLRYTFPESTYNTYALSTLEIGATGADMDIYRPGDTLPDLGYIGRGDVTCDGQLVMDRLIVQTADSITIEARGTDTSTYPAYDEKMTSYNVGVSRAFVYGGYAWLDETTDASGNITSDGLMGATETKLKDVEVTFYEVVDGTLVPANDVEGNPAVRTTDSNGYFEVRLYPNRTYVARTSTANTNGIYKPSPITLNTNPLVQYDDNDLKLTADKMHQETFLIATGVQFDPTTGKPIMDPTDSYYGLYNSIGLGYVQAGRGYIGKYVWDDKNYDGIRNSYTSSGAVVSEPGIENVKLILEKYYYDPEAVDADGSVVGAWIPVTADTRLELSNSGGSYTFQNVPTTYTVGDKVYLAGYKVSVDLDSIEALPTRYAITKFFMNGGLDDSDLPVTATTGNSYLQVADSSDMDSHGMIIMAELATSTTASDYVITHEGKDYDASEGKMLLDLDLGLTEKESGVINGKVWEDKNYDGLQNQYNDTPDTTVDEPGVAGVELEAIQYYRKDGKWVQKTDFVSPTITTDANGNYSVALDTYVTIDGVDYLTSYQIRVKSESVDAKYAVTKYKVGTDTTIDSNLIDATLYLTETDEYLILADQITDTRYDKEYIISNDLGYFDTNKAEVIEGYDGGLVEYQKASLSGKIWDDVMYNGIFDHYELSVGEGEIQVVTEPCIADTVVTLQQYYLDADDNWQPAPAWVPQTTMTNVDGDYAFTGLDTHVVVEGKHYLAGYKVMVDPASAPDKAHYGITIYRASVPDGERNSDLTNDYEIYHGDSHTILAAPAVGTVKNTPYLKEVEGVLYDYVTAKDNPNNDGGFTGYQKSKICGNVFEDADYDGLFDSEENYDDILKTLDPSVGKNLMVTMTSWYYGPMTSEDGTITMGWQPKMITNDEGILVQETASTLVEADGTYSFEEVATQAYIVDPNTGVGAHYLAGYKLSINLIPDGFGTTLYLVNGGTGDSSLYIDGSSLTITKTDSEDGYIGTKAEEMDGYIVTARPVKDGASSTFAVVEGYDLLAGRTLSEYNAGYHKEGQAMITGTVFDDPNYDGIYEMDTEDGINDVTVYLDQYYLKDGEWVKADTEAYAETVTTTVGGEDGIFVFDMLPAKVVTDGGIAYLASYRIRIGEIPEGYAVTKLNQRTDAGYALDETRDSDMLSGNHELVLGDGSDDLDGYIVTAKPLASGDARNEEYIREYNGQEYDIQESVAVNDYDAGLVEYQPGSIGGLIWMDNSENEETNYNGIQDEGEVGIEGQTVLLSQYVLVDGDWELVEDFSATSVTDKDGNYLFENLPVYRETDEGKRQLYAYQLQVESLMEGYAVTKYRQGEDRTKDSDLDLETLRLTEEKEFILLAKDVTDETYRNNDYVEVVDNGLFEKPTYYDIVVGEHNRDYDGGYTPFMAGSIKGLIWMDYREYEADASEEESFADTNYNGIQDEGEAGIEGQTVLLSQYVRVDGKWELVEDFTAASVTDEDGYYHFENLPVFRETEDGERQLYSYRLKVEALIEGYAVTKYRQGEDTSVDSDLNAETLELTTEEEYIILAIDVTDSEYRNEEYVVEVKDGFFSAAKYYDLVGGVNATGYDGGYTQYPLGSIEGIAFEDGDKNGLYGEEKDKLRAGMTIYLKQYYYNMESEEWIEMSEGYDAETVTDENGEYRFDNLPTYIEVEEKWYLCGYKLWLKEIPSSYEAAQYQKNDGEGDSALVADTLQIVKGDERLAEMQDGYIVIALNNSEDEYRNMSNTIGDYDIAAASRLTNYNVGIAEKPVDTGDHSHPVLWLVILLMSGSVALYEGVYGRRRRFRKMR